MSLLLLIVQTMRQLAATPNRKICKSHRNHTICNKRNATEDSLITIGNFHICCQVSHILIPTMQIILIYVNESHAFQRSIPSILMDSFLQKKKCLKKRKAYLTQFLTASLQKKDSTSSSCPMLQIVDTGSHWYHRISMCHWVIYSTLKHCLRAH